MSPKVYKHKLVCALEIATYTGVLSLPLGTNKLSGGTEATTHCSRLKDLLLSKCRAKNDDVKIKRRNFVHFD